MGFDLTATKPKKEAEWSTGNFSWDWMLGEGVGAPIGYIRSEVHGQRCSRYRLLLRGRGYREA